MAAFDDIEEKKDEVAVEQPSAVTPQPKPQYTNVWDEFIAEDENRLKQQEEEDRERIKKLNKGRQYWIGANMLANALGNAINVFGTGNGAPAMKMPDMDTSYLKTWKESDDLRRANYQKMKDQYDRLRLGQMQRDQQIADMNVKEQKAKLQREEEIQNTIASLKANYGDKYGKNLTEKQWRAWAEHKITPDVVRRGEEDEAFKTSLEQEKQKLEQANTIKNNASNAERQKQIDSTLATLQSYDPSITRKDVEDYLNSGGIPNKKIADVLRENNINTASGKRSNKSTLWVGNGSGSDKYNVYCGDYVLKAENQGKQRATIGQLRSKVLQAIRQSALYKELDSDEQELFTHAAAKSWNVETLNDYIDYFGLFSDNSFVESLKSIGFTAPDGTTDTSGLSQKEVDAFNTYFGGNSK